MQKTNADADPLSFSCWITDKPASKHGFDGIQRRTRLKWVEDSSVTQCIKCKSQFGWRCWLHHCRHCGLAFCDSCSSRRSKIPLEVQIPEPLHGTNEGRDPNEPLRVCDECFVKLKQLHRQYERPANWASYTSFITWTQDIGDLKRLSKVCTEWNRIANYQLSRFFDLQYHIPGQRYESWQREMLWTNRHYFPGHSRWMVQLIRSVEYQTTDGLQRIDEICRLIEEHMQTNPKTKKEHWMLMCNRYCRGGFKIDELITMLDESVPNEKVRRHIVRILDTVYGNDPDLLDWISYFVLHISTADCPINESVLGEWLMKISQTNIMIANNLYWDLACLTNSNESRRSKDFNRYNYWMKKWQEMMPIETINKVMLTKTFSDGCAHVSVPNPVSRKTSSSSSSSSSAALAPKPAPNNVQAFFIKSDKVICPTNINMQPSRIDLGGVKVFQSITKPIKIPFIGGLYPCALWKGEDLRKDHIVMTFLRLADKILKRELNIDFHIVTYNVRPTNLNAGFIEMVPDSTTLYEMDSRGGQSGNNLFNFVSGDSKIDELQDRLLKSCAAYSTLTYLLGAGDRHLHNIMITKDAKLFHIDYGYVMGADPKKLIGLTRAPDMRIDSNIVDLLGPPEQFEKFKNMIDEIYNCLRRHVQPLTSVLRMLVLSDLPIHIQKGFDEKRLMREVLTRFAPGEHTEQARIQIINRIDNSTRSTTHYAIVDSLHHHAQTSAVLQAIVNSWQGIKSTIF